MVHAVPEPKLHNRPEPKVQAVPVERVRLGKLLQGRLPKVLLEQRIGKWRQQRDGQIVECHVPLVVDRRAGKGIEELKVELLQRKDKVLVERKVDQPRRAHVGVSSVHHHQPFQESKLRRGVVGRTDRLRSFLAVNANSDIRLLNHGDVIPSIANCQGCGLATLLDQPHDLRLLQWRHAAADYRFAVVRHGHKLLRELLDGEGQ
mmetsp:Transcript_27720/g.67340  ORF Transcript_27720/g.67340 Transcript_27720/m.67340 type:complete len:204 (-) Transcript_27720:1372-1983(-)